MTDHELPRDLTEADIEAILAVPYEPAPDGLPLTRHITAEEAATAGLALTLYGDVDSGPDRPDGPN